MEMSLAFRQLSFLDRYHLSSAQHSVRNSVYHIMASVSDNNLEVEFCQSSCELYGKFVSFKQGFPVVRLIV